MSQEIIITNSVWKKTSGGKCYYLYSGKKGAGAEAAVSVTLVDMADSGLKDLYVKLYYTLDLNLLASNEFSGFELSINDEEVFFTKEDFSGAQLGIQTYEFILPASSKLKILGLAENATAERACSLIAHPMAGVYA